MKELEVEGVALPSIRVRWDVVKKSLDLLLEYVTVLAVALVLVLAALWLWQELQPQRVQVRVLPRYGAVCYYTRHDITCLPME